MLSGLSRIRSASRLVFIQKLLKIFIHANTISSIVSHALRDSDAINPETKRLVAEYAQRLTSRPNSIALSLKKRSRIIGVIVPQIADNYFLQVTNGIEAVAHDRAILF